MRSGFMFIWAAIVSAVMVYNYRNKVKADKNLAKVNWETYKVKLSQSWWSGFLWASVALTIYYFVIQAGLTD
jgi:hypothetical protein